MLRLLIHVTGFDSLSTGLQVNMSTSNVVIQGTSRSGRGKTSVNGFTRNFCLANWDNVCDWVPITIPISTIKSSSFISIPDGGVIVSDSFAPAPVSETVKLSSFEPDEPLQLERPEIVPLVEIFGPVVIVS